MSVYYPQASMILNVLWEDFGNEGDASLQKLYTLPIIAKRVTVHRNDYTTADTFDAEIDYKNFPFDPRCIRACGVSIFIQDMKRVYDGDNAATLINPSADNVVFQGFVDEESLEFDDDKRTVRFEGRDFTSLLIDAKYLENKPIPLTTPLDEILSSLLAQLRATEQIKLDNRTGRTLPTLGSFAPDFGALGAHKNVGKDDTYWEIIQDLVSRAGLIAFIELDKLVLTTPRVLYDKSNAKQFVYGHNIKTLKFKRKLGRHKGFNITVRYMDLATKKVLQVKLPEEGTATWSQKTGIPAKRVQVPVVKPDGTLDTPKDAPFTAFLVANIKDNAQLIEVGEKIFEEMSRQQIEGEFDTHEMDTKDKEKKCFNLTKLMVATPIGIEIDAGDMKGMTRFTTPQERERFLRSRCYEPNIARAMSKTMGKFTPVFYTKAATFTVDSESGFKMHVEFLNFIDLDNKGIDFG